MPLAYLILAHKQPQQLARLFRAIHHEADTVVLHIDARAPQDMHALASELAARHPNVRVLPPRGIVWGGFGIVAVQLEAMAAALDSRRPWRHFVNLSGQDFPLRPRAEIITDLAARPETSFVRWFDPIRNPLWKNARDRMTRVHLTHPAIDRLLHTPGLGRRLRALLGCRNSLPVVPFYRRRWPDFFRYYGGSNHVVLSRAACDYLVTAPAAHRIARWLRSAAIPDEIFFQSALLNSPLAPTILNDDRREIDFPAYAAHPRVFTADDFPRLRSSEKYWARKFDESVDGEILRLLSSHLGLPSAA